MAERHAMRYHLVTGAEAPHNPHRSMSIQQTIKKIDAACSQEAGMIEVTGTTPAGEKIEMWLERFEDGSIELWPGSWFLPYGGIWSCPILKSIKH